MGSPVVEMWVESPTLMHRAAAGRLALVGDHRCIDRSDVVANGDVIAPVLKFLGQVEYPDDPDDESDTENDEGEEGESEPDSEVSKLNFSTVAPTKPLTPTKPVATEVDPAKVAKCSSAEVGHEGSIGDVSAEQKQLEVELANLQAQEELLNEMAALQLLEEEQLKLEEMRSLVNSSIPASSRSAPFPVGTLSV
eukprot:s1158_g8.t1